MPQNQPNQGQKAKSFMFWFHHPLVEDCLNHMIFSVLWLCLYIAQQAHSLLEKTSWQRRKTYRSSRYRQPSDGCELSVTSDKLKWTNEIQSRHQKGQFFYLMQSCKPDSGMKIVHKTNIDSSWSVWNL